MALVYIFVFLFGLAVGSFLNVVTYRLVVADGLIPKVRDRGFRAPASPFRGRSHCPHCKHALAWYDLIPLLSFAILGGRCRYCKENISIQYPLVEIATAALFLLSFLATRDLAQPDKFQILSIEALAIVYVWVIASLLVVLFVYDLRHYILPDKILFPAIFVACIWYFVSGIFFDFYTRYEILHTIYAALGATAFFLAIFLLSRGKAMGFGDVKLAFFMGLFLGWPNILVALFAAFFAGAAVGIVLIALRKKGMKSEIPFGPFLIGGTFVALFFGKEVVNYYIHLLGV